VWRADLSEVQDTVTASLDAGERRRAAAIIGPSHSRLWARSRGVLRALLGLYLHVPPDSVALALDARGKPFLSDAAGHADISPADAPATVSFSLSHSGGLALYAFASAGAVGVDVEAGVGRDRLDTVAIAARVFGAGEAARLQSLDAVSRSDRFLSMWVRHEARLKCLGVGLLGARVALAQSEPWLADVSLERPARGAVAASVAPGELRCWMWPPA
jgi:4'-phosphopantetheinyl transferase